MEALENIEKIIMPLFKGVISVNYQLTEPISPFRVPLEFWSHSSQEFSNFIHFTSTNCRHDIKLEQTIFKLFNNWKTFRFYNQFRKQQDFFWKLSKRQITLRLCTWCKVDLEFTEDIRIQVTPQIS